MASKKYGTITLSSSSTSPSTSSSSTSTSSDRTSTATTTSTTITTAFFMILLQTLQPCCQCAAIQAAAAAAAATAATATATAAAAAATTTDLIGKQSGKNLVEIADDIPILLNPSLLTTKAAAHNYETECDEVADKIPIFTAKHYETGERVEVLHGEDIPLYSVSYCRQEQAMCHKALIWQRQSRCQTKFGQQAGWIREIGTDSDFKLGSILLPESCICRYRRLPVGIHPVGPQQSRPKESKRARFEEQLYNFPISPTASSS